MERHDGQYVQQHRRFDELERGRIELVLQFGWHLRGEGGQQPGRRGALLPAIFPVCDEPLEKALEALAKEGGAENVEFIVDVLSNYRGEGAIHPVVQEIVVQSGTDEIPWNRLEILLENTGVVSHDVV